jgi:hypothetical protein
MPSVGEIFTISGVAVGSGVDVACGVEVAGICVGVFSGASEAVGVRGAGALWQAVSKKMMRRSGMNFFIGFFVATGDSHYASDCHINY